MNDECLDFVVLKFLSSLQIELKEAHLVQCSDSWQCKNQICDYNLIYYIMDGEFKLKIDNKEFTVTPGQMVLIPSGKSVTCLKTTEKKLYKYWCKFNATVNKKNIFDSIETKYIINVENTKYTEDLFYYMLFKNSHKNAESKILYKQSYLIMIISLFIEQAFLQRLNLINSNVNFEPVIDYMYNKMSEYISISDLSSLVHLNNDYFSQLFKKIFSESPIKFLNEMRIQRAKKLLNETILSINEVAEKVGITDMPYFFKLYKENFGYTPKYQRTNYKGASD